MVPIDLFRSQIYLNQKEARHLIAANRIRVCLFPMPRKVFYTYLLSSGKTVVLGCSNIILSEKVKLVLCWLVPQECFFTDYMGFPLSRFPVMIQVLCASVNV